MVKNRKYVHKNDKSKEVYTVGLVEYLPEKKPIVIYVTLSDGKAKACDEAIFNNAYILAAP